MSEESLYALLGVPESASNDALGRAFVSESPGWESVFTLGEAQRTRFIQRAAAYAILTQPALRAGYDLNPGEVREKVELAFDLAARGYDEEMLAEYLLRLGVSAEFQADLVRGVEAVREAFVSAPLDESEEPAMVVRKVRAAQGWRWLVDGFALFRRNPLIWITLTVIQLGIVFALSLVPVAGELAFNVLFPVFIAGFWIGCRALDEGNELELAHLFAGFQKNTPQLLAVGAVNLVGQVLLLILMVSLGGEALSKLLLMKAEVAPTFLSTEMPRIMLAMTVGMLLSVPLLMLIWFAPMLVVFQDMPAKEAMQTSFQACVSNSMPFLVFGAVGMGLAFAAMVLTLGLGLLVLFPVMILATYASYKDIFEGGRHIDIEVD